MTAVLVVAGVTIAALLLIAWLRAVRNAPTERFGPPIKHDRLDELIERHGGPR